MQHKKIKIIQINNTEYKIAKVSLIVFARILDIFFSSLFLIAISFIFKPIVNHSQVAFIIILIFSAFIFLFFYFVILPFYTKTKTLGRLILGIKIYNPNKIKFHYILLRELMIIFIPWFIGITINLIIVFLLKININQIFNPSKLNGNEKAALLFLKISSTFIIFWYIFMFIGLIIDKNNQLFFDFKMQNFLIKKSNVLITNKNIDNNSISKEINHIHLAHNQPGNINIDALDEIIYADEIKENKINNNEIK